MLQSQKINDLVDDMSCEVDDLHVEKIQLMTLSMFHPIYIVVYDYYIVQSKLLKTTNYLVKGEYKIRRNVKTHLQIDQFFFILQTHLQIYQFFFILQTREDHLVYNYGYLRDFCLPEKNLFKTSEDLLGLILSFNFICLLFFASLGTNLSYKSAQILLFTLSHQVTSSLLFSNYTPIQIFTIHLPFSHHIVSVHTPNTLLSHHISTTFSKLNAS